MKDIGYSNISIWDVTKRGRFFRILQKASIMIHRLPA